MRILQSEPRYQAIDLPPYTVVAYTPLYYWVAAALQAIVGPAFGPGRALSLIAGVAPAAAIAVIAVRRTGHVWTGSFVRVFFLALAFPRCVPLPVFAPV